MIASQRLARIPGAEEARAFLAHAYTTRLKREGRTVEHPIAVAELLAQDGQPPPVVVAGLLHDVLEDTEATEQELRSAFGPEITGLVAALTQDPAIRKYSARKSALRRQILDGGSRAATVSLADKVAKLRTRDARPRTRQLKHYRKTLVGIETCYDRSRLSGLLREQLNRWEASE